VKERVDVEGKVLLPIDRKDVEEQVKLLAKEGVEAVAISFLHSHLHPAHEALAKEVTKELLPEAWITVG